MHNYGIKENYQIRPVPQYFEDTLDDSALWQADVYRLASYLGAQHKLNRLIDIGCGRGHKLAALAGEFAITGIDYGTNIDACKAQYPQGTWLTYDLEHDFIGQDVISGRAIVICADVIEHLQNPSALIEILRSAADNCEYVLVSTPDRERVYKHDQDGPPMNPCHVREWTLAELVAYFESEHLPIAWAGWTVSNDKWPDQMHTSLIVLSSKHTVATLPLTYQPAARWRPTVHAHKRHFDHLRVWMTPTPSEAARDTTNAIHQVVLQLESHLPAYGVELVEFPDNADVRAAHAGQGSDEPVDVAHYHGLYNTAAGHDNAGFFAINSHVIQNLRTAKIITAPSEWIADVIRRDMHINPEIVGWGVDPDEWTPADDASVYVLWNKARVDAISDPTPMLELAKRAPHVPFLTTFGQGGANVRTIGRQPYEVMKNYVRHAGVYLATVTETFGIATLEAMAAGVPVLGFRHGNTAHLVEHGVTGFLAEPGDYDGLLNGLEYCLQYRDRLGANAREVAKRYSWARVAEQMAALYRQALESHTGAKVSVVIPCHNYGHYVGEAIESALAQEANFDVEIIVVLDRCTDNSADVVARYPRVKAITVNHGSLSATRNTGITAATGEYIVCLDADDRLGSSAFVQVLAEALDADRTLGIAFTGISIIDADGGGLRKNPWPRGYDFDLQARRMNQVPSCCMFRKEAWKRAGGFRPWFKYAEDAEFWLTVGSLGYGGKHVVDDGWFHYRLHSGSASQVHRTGEVKEPDWTEFHPWTRDGQRPFAAGGKPPRGSWPVRFYLKPNVSVIIPVSGWHQEQVKDALHSLEGQTHRFWECIVVNDSPAQLDLTGFPWAKVINTPSAGIGAGAARNLGVKHSHAPFLVFLDADDILKPPFLEQALATYQQTGRYAYSDWMTDDRRGHTQTHTTPEYSLQAFWNNPSLHPITALIPRRWFDDVGGFDETLPAYEDVDLYMKFLTHGYCGQRMPAPLLVYNLDAGERRKQGATWESEFKALLKDRYGAFMEGREMCDCVEPPKGKPRVAPSQDNVSAYRETYGEAVEVRYIDKFAPVSPVTLLGPATRAPYGARAKGDVFYIWQADLDNSDGMFERVEHFEPAPLQTEVPPPPEPITPEPEEDTKPSEATEPAEPAPDEKPDLLTLLEGKTKAEMVAWANGQHIDLTRDDLKNRETLITAILAGAAAKES